MDAMTPKAARQLEAIWALEGEGLKLLDLVAAEFKTDPKSVQCFDLRIVRRVIEVTDELRARRKSMPLARREV